MKKFFTILLLFATLNGFSQNFAPPGATWHYSFSTTFFNGVTKIFNDGDTLIQGILAQKLQLRRSSTNWETGQTFYDVFAGYEYTYADQDHVYQLIGDEFKMLYDFTVQPNDTVLIYNSEYYDWENACDSVGRAIVTETGFEIVNGLELRWYNVTTLEESPYILNGRIIERIGIDNGFLFSLPSDCLFISEWLGGFIRCYTDDNFPEYRPPNYNGPCEFITGIDKITKANLGLVVYPNPASETVNISVSENVSVSKVRVYNVTGLMVINQSPQPPSPRGSQITLDVSRLVSGMYLLEVETGDGFREMKRLVIE